MLDATAEAILDLHEGRTDEAMENLLLALSTANILADEPSEHYQRLRWRQLEVGRQACWEALQFKGWTDEQLAQYQKEWERMDLVSDASKCLAMDLAREAMAFRQIRISKPEFDTYFRPPDRDTGEITATVNSWMQKGVSYPRYWPLARYLVVRR
jgi:hypothetical protein